MIGKRYQFVIDIDGVLLDIITPTLLRIFKHTGCMLSEDDIITYDFNKSAKDESFNLNNMIGDKINFDIYDLIYDYLKSEQCYHDCVPDVKAIALLRKCAEEIMKKDLPIDIILYTKIVSDKTNELKHVLMNKYLINDYPCIRYRYVSGDKEAYENADVVIEDSLDNIKLYNDNVLRYIVTHPYNKHNVFAPQNTLNDDIEYSSTFRRVDSTRAAIADAWEIIIKRYNVMTNITTDDVVQWCLNNGTGIVCPITEDNKSQCRTTQREIERAKLAGELPRYVHNKTSDYFMNHKRIERTKYAVANNLTSMEFDEWQALQDVLFANAPAGNNAISYETANKIISILHDDCDITPLDLLPSNLL